MRRFNRSIIISKINIQTYSNINSMRGKDIIRKVKSNIIRYKENIIKKIDNMFIKHEKKIEMFVIIFCIVVPFAFFLIFIPGFIHYNVPYT